MEEYSGKISTITHASEAGLRCGAVGRMVEVGGWSGIGWGEGGGLDLVGLNRVGLGRVELSRVGLGLEGLGWVGLGCESAKGAGRGWSSIVVQPL